MGSQRTQDYRQSDRYRRHADGAAGIEHHGSVPVRKWLLS
jgi:hypothetical protein